MVRGKAAYSHSTCALVRSDGPIDLGLLWLLTTSRIKQNDFTRNVKVGPRGTLAIRMFVPPRSPSVLLKTTKCVTPKGAAMCTKSFSTFFFRTWKWRGRATKVLQS